MFLPRLPIQVGKAVSFLVIVAFLAAAVVGLGRPMVHPQHVEQPSSEGAVLLVGLGARAD